MGMRQKIVALIMVFLIYAPLIGATAAMEDRAMITGVEMTGPRELTLYYSAEIDSESSEFAFNYELLNVGSPHTAKTNQGNSVTLMFSVDLPVGSTYDLVVKNIGPNKEVHSVLLVEQLDFYGLKKNIETRNRTVKANDITLTVLSSSGDTLKTARDGLLASYLSIDNTIKNFPPMTLPFPSDTVNPYEIAINAMRQEAYLQELSALQSTRKSVQDQMMGVESQRVEMEHTKAKLELQREMVIGQLTWASENLLMAYYTLESQLLGLQGNLKLIETQLIITRLQESFGMLRKADVTTLENTWAELLNTEMLLSKQMDNIKRDLNLLLGNSYNTPLIIKPLVDQTQLKLDELLWENDLKEVLKNNYSLRVAEYEASIKRQNAQHNNTSATQGNLDAVGLKYQDDKAKLELAFFKAHQDLEMAARNLEAEKAKFALEEEKYAHAVLRHKLGLTSRVQYMTDTNAYSTQERRLRDLELDYFKAARKYHWFINGLTL